ncbi:hypothetical protein CC80DRAFT_470332 [Byssothecium circinans]|uniref:Uncharacterized protein n=1 Tax=Byssothecium circinans TaxID=147558 RepID=A0A6A5U1B6_9PLEO|nr:hypothetical protein CC80DRAFT_470332 [Byssothecium circinans]
MNFVDVQPESFLDYAWTSPSAAPSNTVKPAKATRKQNRCCDQCRKGKRACDAAILEDTLLGENGASEGHPTAFHYSDVFGSLARCGNCEKTKKTCTFQWLRSQRVSQVTQQSGSTPLVKRRRTRSRPPQDQVGVIRQPERSEAPQRTAPSGPPSQPEFVSPSGHLDLDPSFDIAPGSFLDYFVDPFLDAFGSGTEDPSTLSETKQSLENAQHDTEIQVDHDSGFQDSPEDGCSSISTTNGYDVSTKRSRAVRVPQKRRHRSRSSTNSGREILYPSASSSYDLSMSTNNALLTESLLKIYRDSFEHHLSCWLTEKTCPVQHLMVSVAKDSRPAWDCVYHQVFRLDRLSFVRGRALSGTEDKAASKALNMAIVAFASQRTQSRNKTEAYPYRGGDSHSPIERLASDDFDENLQTSAWHQARNTLLEAEGIESFRVALALIVFSLTQKPSEIPEPEFPQSIPTQDARSNSQLDEEIGGISEHSLSPPADEDVDKCQNMLSKLRIVIDGDGPPIYLEKGLRLLHSLRSRLTMTGTMARPKKMPNGNRTHLQAKQLDTADRVTVDLLFWLAMMFDTLSSAMYKRPLVVSLEDSDIPANSEMTKGQASYDKYLFSHPRLEPVRWPCSHGVASSLLCEAAPIKVLLFRKVTRIQSLLSRGVQGRKIEEAVQMALEVFEHWQTVYAPFFQDVFNAHNQLPAHLRSWSICVTGHFHLAALLLADLVEIIDDAEASVVAQRRKRRSTGFVASFRKTNCRALSDIARCACPREDGFSDQSLDPNTAVNLEALLSEPWTAVLIRAFAMAGVYLLDLAGESYGDNGEQDDAFRRADDCICALWYLGRKSNMAQMAAKMLGGTLRNKQVGDVNSCVDLWSGFDHVDESFGVACV